MAAIAKAFSEGELSELRTAMILEHAKVAGDLYRVRYDNGMTVYVNYSEAEQQADGLTIPAKDYLVVKEGLE